MQNQVKSIHVWSLVHRNLLILIPGFVHGAVAMRGSTQGKGEEGCRNALLATFLSF